jgi:hypothetical protein
MIRVRSHRAALLRVTIAASAAGCNWCAASWSRPTEGGGRETKRGGEATPDGRRRSWWALVIVAGLVRGSALCYHGSW